jgi:hypothetical protein
MNILDEELRARGFAHVRATLDRASYLELARQLGDAVGTEIIALRPRAHAYVAKPGPVPLHTDHPAVDVIGWLCEAQDEADGASQLLDTRPIVDGLTTKERDELERVGLACPPLAGGPATERWPVLRRTAHGTAVFSSPWLRVIDDNAARQGAHDAFRQRLSHHARRAVEEVRLAPGEALFIDNRRILHGRRSITGNSHRTLVRVWLQGSPARARVS